MLSSYARFAECELQSFPVMQIMTANLQIGVQRLSDHDSMQVTLETKVQGSSILRKQVLIAAVAIFISIFVISLSFLETKSIFPKGISIPTLYIVLLFVWPCLSSFSGGMVSLTRRQPAKIQRDGGVLKRAVLGFRHGIMPICLSVIGVAMGLEVLARIPLSLGEGLPKNVQTWAMAFKDFAYLILADQSFPASNSWFVRFNFIGYHGAFKLLLGIFASLVCYACALLFSFLMSRAITAAISGYFVGMGISWAIIHCWIRLNLTEFDDVFTLAPGELGWIISVLGLSALFIFILTLFLPRNITLHIGKAKFIGLLFTLGIAGIVFFAFAYPHSIRLSPQTAVAWWSPAMSVDGKTIVAAVYNRNFTPSQIWSISTEGRGIKRLTGRLADHPFLSPDGNWIAYLSQRNILGLVRDSVDLRAVRINGTQDRSLARQVTENPYFTLNPCGHFAFSPNSTRVALACDDTLFVAELNGVHTIRIPLPSIRCWWWHVAWDRTGSEVIVAPDPPTDVSPGPLLACDPASGRIRTVRENPDGQLHFIFPSTTNGVQFVFFGDSVLDVATGKEKRITEAVCYAAGISDDQRFLVYATARQKGTGAPETEIHWHELVSGHDKIVAAYPGLFLSEPFLVSPAGDMVIANDNFPPMKERAVLIEKTGAVRNFLRGWMAFGWASNHEIGLSKPLERAIPMAIGDAKTMKMRIIHQ